MRKLLLSLVCGVSAMVAQSTNYPTSLDTNSTLFVTSDNVQTVLTNAVLVGDTALVVQSNTGFAANQIATVCDTLNTSNVCTAWEHMLVTSISGGNVIFVTRGFAGTAAAPHQSGKTVAVLIDSAHQSVLKQAVIAIENALGANMGNIPGSPSGAAVPIAKGGTGATTQGGALSAILGGVPLPVANGGTGNTAVQGNGAKTQLSTGSTSTNDCTKFDANGNTVDSGAPCNALPAASAQLQYLRTSPNTGNNATYGFAALPVVSAADYNYPAQTPGGALSSGVGATVTLTPCPFGVVGTDQRLRFYISGGTGAAESVASTGAGSCISGAATGTVTFTPANSHTGAWTIQSSLAGIYEAIAANPGKEIVIPAGTYTMHDCMSLDPAKVPLTVRGDGSGTTFGTFLDFGAVTSGCDAISISNSSVTNNGPYLFRNFAMQGTGTTTGGNGVYLQQVVRVIFDHVQVNSFAKDGILTSNAFEISVINGSVSLFNGQWGWAMSGISNLNRCVNSYIGNNSRSDGYGGINVTGTSALVETEQILIDGCDFSNNGATPFTSTTSTYGLFVQWVTGITVINSYSEGNKTNAILYQGATHNITEFNNWFNTVPVGYASDTVGVKSFGNTFYSAAAVRSWAGANLSTFDIGPDNCLNSSTECTIHPRLLATPALAFASLPTGLTAGQQLYCTNCTTAATCTSGGSGHMAIYNGTTWTCQ